MYEQMMEQLKPKYDEFCELCSADRYGEAYELFLTYPNLVACMPLGGIPIYQALLETNLGSRTSDFLNQAQKYLDACKDFSRKKSMADFMGQLEEILEGGTK